MALQRTIMGLGNDGMTAISVMLDLMEMSRTRTLATLDEIAKLPIPHPSWAGDRKLAVPTLVGN